MVISGQYLTYTEYQSLGGTLDQNSFSLLEYNARKKINERTFGRLIDLNNIPEEVKICDFELIELINSYSSYNEQNKNVSSEGIDGYSISYIAPNKSITEAQNTEIESIINTYLSNTVIDNVPVLYRGVK